jgi:predicted dienelactone hydrolase
MNRGDPTVYEGEPSMSIHVGCRTADTVDPVSGARLALTLLYPTRVPGATVRFGPYALTLGRDAPPEGNGLPLVAVSHGTGGSPWVYRDLAAHLARAGFAVLLLEHPGNSRNDNSLANSITNLENRPRHLSMAIDAAFADSLLGPRLSRPGVAVIGHSLGGYTALAVAGGRPYAFPHESPTEESCPIAVTPDSRVRAIVLLAPASVWFAADGALDAVDVPILMRTGEKDEHTPAFHAEIVKRGVRDPNRVDHAVVRGGGHFAFLTPFPAEMVSPGFPPSQDPAGFDRAAFLPGLYAEVLTFLRRAL